MFPTSYSLSSHAQPIYVCNSDSLVEGDMDCRRYRNLEEKVLGVNEGLAKVTQVNVILALPAAGMRWSKTGNYFSS